MHAGDDDEFWIARCEEIIYEDQEEVSCCLFELIDAPTDVRDDFASCYVMSPYLDERIQCIDMSTVMCKVSASCCVHRLALIRRYLAQTYSKNDLYANSLCFDFN